MLRIILGLTSQVRQTEPLVQVVHIFIRVLHGTHWEEVVLMAKELFRHAVQIDYELQVRQPTKGLEHS